ncbi:HEAT repeat protein [Roseiarcus fermentans]|uniref:HEAT repeat protein n=1 Tax=Roseiarcus fermentans TaxID=1473586 RepID=A0A366FQ67_9HYPH|nr:HEAT repeat domain-containing protein [Roseiarcus fermentans]RBP16180.1 HEAT repeat protein [Roseiarcus fermentans]
MARAPTSPFLQLDLFGARPKSAGPCAAISPQPGPRDLPDEVLIAAIPEATLADAPALAQEAGRRRLAAAAPALAALCNRFVGYGAEARVPEQAAALEALGALGGPEASRAVLQAIAKRVVQGPTLAVAASVAAQLGVVFPADVALALLRHPDPAVRAPACACVRAGLEVVATLIAMMDDPDAEAAAAAACALGRMQRTEPLRRLKRLLRERPSRRVVEALAGIADDEAVVLLARAARARPDLTPLVLAALDEIETPRSASVAAALRKAEGRSE